MKTGVLRSSRAKRLYCAIFSVIAIGSFLFNDVMEAGVIGQKYPQLRPLAAKERRDGFRLTYNSSFKGPGQRRQALARLLIALRDNPTLETDRGQISQLIAKAQGGGITKNTLKEWRELWRVFSSSAEGERVGFGETATRYQLGRIRTWQDEIIKRIVESLRNTPGPGAAMPLGGDLEPLRGSATMAQRSI